MCPVQTNHFGQSREPPCCRDADEEFVAFVVPAPPKCGGQMRDPASQPMVAIKVRQTAKLTAWAQEGCLHLRQRLPLPFRRSLRVPRILLLFSCCRSLHPYKGKRRRADDCFCVAGAPILTRLEIC